METGPISVFGSSPLPTGIFSTYSANFATTSSYWDSCTYSRFSAAHVWPALMKQPQNSFSSSGSMFVPGSTTPASLPPSSSVTRFSEREALSITFLPVATEPVNTILSMPG